MTIKDVLRLHESDSESCWHQHPNGGGWVFRTAKVDPSAFIGENAMVYGKAMVLGRARVSGNSRVYDDSVVFGNSWVYDDAHVCGRAMVSGNARVCGDAMVCGGQVSGNALVSTGEHLRSPLYIQGSRNPITVCSTEVVNIGCESMSIKEWLRVFRDMGQKYAYSEVEVDEYKQYLVLIATIYAQ